MSGHSKWSTIKRAKGAADAKRGQLFTKLAREITVAARSGSGDPDSNARLRLAIQKARSESMPKDNIERALERAIGAGSTENYDEIYYEGYGPGGIALMVFAMTDNRNRTASDVRAAFTRGGGNLGETGVVSWMFDHVGQIIVESGTTDPDEISLIAIDAGASDVLPDEEIVEIYTEVQDLHKVQEALTTSGLTVQSAELTMKPKTLQEPTTDEAIKAIRLIERLEDLDDVQTVYSNLNLTDDVLAQV
ncbi:MAG: YebC/PmpR family DNA-binding transcriptional regulator [Thermomicrobiales bacterium]